jgi:hypothetical protein
VNTRNALRADVTLARHAQQLRAEESAGFFGSDKVAPAEHTERRLTLADADREAAALAQHHREQARHYRELRAAGLTGLTPEQVFDRVLEHTSDQWKAQALQAIARAAQTGRRFQAIDLIRYGATEPDHPNRWGAVLHLAHTRGLIRCAGYAPSERPATKRSILRTWRGTTTTRRPA